jgi:hypothetical protein
VNQLFRPNEGNIYLASYRNETIADNGTINICFSTPAAVTGATQIKRFHCYFWFSASGADYAGCDLQISENPTTWSGGTSKSWYNIDRTADNTTTLQDIDDLAGAFDYDGTTSTETVIYQEASGQGNIGGMGLIEAGTPLRLKANEDYAFIVTSDTGATTLNLNILIQEIN